MIVVSMLIPAAVPVAAQEVSAVQFSPVVARTAGVGTSQWVSDPTVHDLPDVQVTVGIQLFSEAQDNTFDPTLPTASSWDPGGPGSSRTSSPRRSAAARTSREPWWSQSTLR